MAQTLWSGFLWQLAAGWGTRLGTLLVFTLLARLLNPEALGAVAYVHGLILLLLVAADLAMAEYLVYRQDAGQDVADAIWWAQLGFSLLLATLLAVLALQPPAWLLPQGVDPLLLAAGAFSMPVLAAGKVPEALMRRTPAGFRSLALRQFWSMLAGAAVALPLAAAGAGAWSLIAKHWVEALLGLLLLFPRDAWRPTRNWQWPLTQRVMRESWGLMASRVVDIAAQRVDSLLIGQWLGVAALGWYSVAQKLYQVLLGTLSGALYGVVNSRLGALRGDAAASRDFLLHALCAASLVMSAVMLAAWLFSAPLVLALFGSKWADSVPLLEIMLLLACLTSLVQTGLAPYPSLVRQDNGWVLALFCADLLLTLLLVTATAPLGLQAVVWALALKPLLLGGLWWLRARQHLGFGWMPWLRALGPAALLLICSAIAWLLAQRWVEPTGLGAQRWTLAGSAVALALLWPLFGARLRAVRQAFHR